MGLNGIGKKKLRNRLQVLQAGSRAGRCREPKKELIGEQERKKKIPTMEITAVRKYPAAQWKIIIQSALFTY